jgi:hypothetical protein
MDTDQAHWMTDAELRELADNRRTLEEVAEENERRHGWRPSRAAVKRKMESMGVTLYSMR